MFKVFSILWAFAILIHQGRAGLFAGVSFDVALDLAVLYVLLRPSPKALVVLAGVQLVTFGWHLPFETNHWWLLTFGDVAILLSALPFALKKRSLDEAAWFDSFAPTLRLHLLILYGFVTLAKLNDGFLNPALSCSTTMYNWLVGKLPLLPKAETAGPLAIYGTLAIEGALIALLAIRRTRPITLLFGTLFHIVLGVNGFYNFSASLLPLYALYLPPELWERMVGLVRAEPRLAALVERVRSLVTHPRAVPVVLGGALAVMVAIELGISDMDLRRRASRLGFLAVWFCVTTAVTALLALALLRTRAAGAPPLRFAPAGPLLWATPVLIVFNGLCPYLGLKTESSFAMFSNMQTEAELWNHVLMPRSMRVFHFQDDLVSIVSSDHPELAAAARDGTRFVWHGFQGFALANPDAVAVFDYKGVRHAPARLGDDPDIRKEPSFLRRKLLWFRDVPRPEHNDCSH
jgi:hypothetical protein